MASTKPNTERCHPQRNPALPPESRPTHIGRRNDPYSYSGTQRERDAWRRWDGGGDWSQVGRRAESLVLWKIGGFGRGETEAPYETVVPFLFANCEAVSQPMNRSTRTQQIRRLTEQKKLTGRTRTNDRGAQPWELRALLRYTRKKYLLPPNARLEAPCVTETCLILINQGSQF
jgi:hypothetical protein